MEHTDSALRWIPLLPLIAAALSGVWLAFFRRRLPRAAVIGIACGAPVISFVLSVREVFRLTQLRGGERFFQDDVYTWIGAHPFHVELSFLLDPLSAVMILVVTGVGSLIHIYSVGYMDADQREDRGFQRYFCYLNLFTFAMLMLVLGDNLLVMFVGWEGVGLCSYLLIGFWYLEDHNAMCGQKAFVVNRIGDFGFLLGIFLLFWAFWEAGHPTLEFRTMAAQIGSLGDPQIRLPDALSFLPYAPRWSLLTFAGILLFVGAAGKSAQLPLYVWLPDAMAGPTPVSALIHAATMVTAGVYMICRMSFLYSLAPTALAVIAWVGALTAFFAATIGICQKDIKKVLAYSTISQLGYMFLAAGVASYSAAIFHLMTHAFFKALLFLGAGSVILGLHHEQDMDRMGGLWRRMPVTHVTFAIGVLAISGAPFFSGFYSKDEILLGAYLARTPGHMALWALGVVTAGITAFYMFRLYFRIFWGRYRGPADLRVRIREQENWILGPLVILAFLAMIGGIFGLPDLWGAMVGVPESNSLYYFLREVVPSEVHEVTESVELGLAGLAVAVGFVGAWLAWILYVRRPQLSEQLGSAWGGLYRLVRDKYYVDELYGLVVIRPLLWLSDRVLFRAIDQRLIDGAGVNGIAAVMRGTSDRALKYLQTGFTQSYVFVMLVGAAVLVGYLLQAS
ncbi:MAG: NADH-quinone oxidoreductase subunit L [Myxococcota bacterium]